MSRTSRHEPQSPDKVLRERCAAAGYLVWTSDASGRLLSEPTLSETAGLILNSHSFNQLLEGRVVSWKGSQPPRVDELWPGCHLVALASKSRGRVQSYILALFLQPGALQDERFDALCQQEMLDTASMREALGIMASCSPGEAERAALLLGRMQEDLCRAALDDRTIDGFTHHLADAYEQMALLHELGRSMTRFTRPGEFFSTVLERLADTLHFRWFSVLIAADHGLPSDIAGHVFCYGMGRLNKDDLKAALWRRASERAQDESSQVISADSLGLSGGGQLALQHVVRGEQVVAMLVAGGKRGDDPQVSSYDTKLMASVAGYVGTFIDNARLEARRNAMFVGSIQALTAIVDAKDHYTLGHSERVALLAGQLAEAVGMPPETAERIHLSGLLHDVGKVGIPEAVLTKTSRLTDGEFEIIKRHPQIGHDILKGIPDFEDILSGVLTHHERWDGTGYPGRLAGDDIPLFGRILCLADSFDAMSSNRAYRSALSRDQVLTEIIRCAGTQFDPTLAPVFAGLDFAAFDAMLAVNAQRSAQYKAA